MEVAGDGDGEILQVFEPGGFLADDSPAAHRAVQAVFPIEYAEALIASLARLVRDLGFAEELAQDALVAALEQWPESGIPEKPGRLVDGHREAPRHQSLAPQKARGTEARRARPRDGRSRGAPGESDGRRGRTTTSATTSCGSSSCACHPVLRERSARRAHAPPARRSLSVRRSRAPSCLTGADGRATNSPSEDEPSREAGVPFEVPRGARARAERLAFVLEVVYLVFNEGYAATSRRRLLCGQRSVKTRFGSEGSSPSSCPKSPRFTGSVASGESTRSRAAARVTASGEPCSCSSRIATRWDPFAHPARARRRRARRSARRRTRAVRAAGGISGVPRASAHAPRRRFRWHRELYEELFGSRRPRSWRSIAPWQSEWRAGPEAGLGSRCALRGEQKLAGVSFLAERTRRISRKARATAVKRKPSSSARRD